MRRFIKICGVNSTEAFDAVFDAQADYLGFNFFPPSPRFVTPSQAAELSARAQGGPKRVGLFVAPEMAAVEAALTALPLDVLQVHGSNELIAAFQVRFGLPVWQSLGVSAAAELPSPAAPANGYVIEAKPPVGANRPGGNAVLADWPLLARFQTDKLWFVAGGLTPENVEAALQATKAPGADVASGVESSVGVKSPVLIKAFIEAVQRA